MTVEKLHTDQRGMTTVEYALLGAVIAVVAIGAFENLGEATRVQADEAARRLRTGVATTDSNALADQGQPPSIFSPSNPAGQGSADDFPGEHAPAQTPTSFRNGGPPGSSSSSDLSTGDNGTFYPGNEAPASSPTSFSKDEGTSLVPGRSSRPRRHR